MAVHSIDGVLAEWRSLYVSNSIIEIYLLKYPNLEATWWKSVFNVINKILL
jgi:hypothetical protein